MYTVGHKKVSPFMIFAPLETGLNTLQTFYKIYDFTLT